MVDVAVDAAETLPEWTPALAAPAPSGLLCWAKPAGVVPFGPATHIEVPSDAAWWWTRPDGVLQIQPSSRLTKNPELLEPFGVQSPLWAAHTVVLNPAAPRTDEVIGSLEASHFVSILGAAWLLMGQPAVADTRTLNSGSDPQRREPFIETGPRREPPTVTIIELRRPLNAARDETPGTSGRQYQRRWWVGGHWRQQPCGPVLPPVSRRLPNQV